MQKNKINNIDYTTFNDWNELITNRKELTRKKEEIYVEKQITTLQEKLKKNEIDKEQFDKSKKYLEQGIEQNVNGVIFSFYKINKQPYDTFCREQNIDGVLFLHNRCLGIYKEGISYCQLKKIEQNNQEVFESFNTAKFQLKKMKDELYSYKTGYDKVYMNEISEEGYKKTNEYKEQLFVDAMKFDANGLKKPLYMDCGDSFIIDKKGKVLWCHAPIDMEGRDNEFNGIKVKLVFEGTGDNQLLFNTDGTLQHFFIDEKEEQKICNIKIGKAKFVLPQNWLDLPYKKQQDLQTKLALSQDGKLPDVDVYNLNEFDFYAKEGEKCCGEEIDFQQPIHYQKVAENKINLSFTNIEGKSCSFIVDEKGRTDEKFQKDVEKQFNIKLSKISRRILDKASNFERYYITAKVVEDFVDGFKIDNNKDVNYVIDYLVSKDKNGKPITNKSITQIYRLDNEKFTLKHDKDKEIIYTKQPNGENFINYYLNGQQQIVDLDEYKKQKFENFYNTANKRTKELIKKGEINCNDGVMKFDKNTGDIWLEKYNKTITQVKNKKNKNLTTINDKKILMNIYK